MAVLMIAEVSNLTEEVYAGMLGQLKPALEGAAGFIAHAGGPSEAEGWRVVEIWESEEASEKWFEENVKPNLPPGVVPERSFHELHSAFTAS